LYFLYSAAQVALNMQGEVVSDGTDTLWAFIFAILVAVWAKKEPKQREFNAPFEFGAFLYFAWPIILPYYLIKTRGCEGWITFMGFLGLYLLPFLSGLLAYVYLTE
jgi:hypothetical protein